MTIEEATKIKLKTVTPEQFKTFDPCWLTTTEGRERFRIVSALRPEWTALDVLVLPDVSAKDKLWSVLREEFLPAGLLHEFACRCAEYALTFVENPDPRSVAAIEAKRAWLRGEITDDELDAALAAARDAAARDAAALAAAWAAAWAAWTTARYAVADAGSAARDAAWGAARGAADAARAAAAWDAAALDAAWDHEVEMLVELIVDVNIWRGEEEAARKAQACGNRDCHHQTGALCPAADGCGGYEEVCHENEFPKD